MKRQIVITGDGSATIQIEDWKEQYHSMHGAIQESEHVFINSGLKQCLNIIDSDPIKILEFGFGTGLNALLTFQEIERHTIDVEYTTIEAYPISEEEIAALNYSDLLGMGSDVLLSFHNAEWEKDVKLSPSFTLRKTKSHFQSFHSEDRFTLVYYDAFGARVQPELWERSIFEKIYNLLEVDGILVTYSSKGSVRRAMEDIGFKVERLKGPPGKRHMLRASKI
ncbi:MAG: tRNA (5-methylaminomethyl-2-thiouridine)(34)-methyltransferase MnmD [Flavobacteriaceae bacterium]|nr:tRNA (5-methylaminomethyl-2-thiouridine)(34)-methyltransferase MnmD [Flavobacteriaceae bacterium]